MKATREQKGVRRPDAGTVSCGFVPAEGEPVPVTVPTAEPAEDGEEPGSVALAQTDGYAVALVATQCRELEKSLSELRGRGLVPAAWADAERDLSAGCLRFAERLDGGDRT